MALRNPLAVSQLGTTIDSIRNRYFDNHQTQAIGRFPLY